MTAAFRLILHAGSDAAPRRSPPRSHRSLQAGRSTRKIDAGSSRSINNAVFNIISPRQSSTCSGIRLKLGFSYPNGQIQTASSFNKVARPVSLHAKGESSILHAWNKNSSAYINKSPIAVRGQRQNRTGSALYKGSK